MRLILLASLIAAATLPAAAQPVAIRVLDATDAVGIALQDSQWKAPPALYWSGVALDAAALAGGAYVIVLGAQILDATSDEGAGAGAFVGALFGPMFIAVGSVAAGAALYDLIRVLRGDNPALARLFDPDRPLPPSVPPRYPVPGPPPGPRH